MRKYFYSFAPNTHCALVVALSENNKYILQCGYRKCDTYARVFSQTLEYGNSKNEVRQGNRRKLYDARGEYGK